MKISSKPPFWSCLSRNFLILSVCIAIVNFNSAIFANEYEKPGPLKVQSVLPAKLIKGTNYEIEETVQNDGFLNTYTIKSPFGQFSATTTNSLMVLIKEFEAITAMKKVETDDTALTSLKQSGQNTVTGLKNLFSEPEDTIDSAVSGVKGLFKRAKGTVGKRGLTDAEDNRLEQLVGISKAKGRIATQYGVSMYSRNKVLQKELDRLARADFVGGLGVGVATTFVPGLGGLILSTSGTARLLNEAINSTPASELWIQNKSKLLKMGVDEDTIELFLNNPEFSPALQTLLTAALETMDKVENRELFIKVSLQASDPVMAKIITETAILTAGYHKNIGPLKKLFPMVRLLRAEKEDGAIVVVLPIDHMVWTKRVAEIASELAKKRNDSPDTKLEMWTLGDFSEKTESRLKDMGWQLHAKVMKQLIPENQ